MLSIIWRIRGEGGAGGGGVEKGELIWNGRGFIEYLRYIKNELFN